MKMEKAPRAELIKKIEAQQEKLERYESRLRDVICAYKGVVKEKEALEASINVLSQSQQNAGHTGDKTGEKDDAENKETDPESDKFEDPLNAASTDKPQGEKKDEDSGKLKDQIKTLSASIATLSQEKSRIESSYVAEKKQLRQENEDLQKNLGEQKQKNTSYIKELEDSVNELKGKIREQQHEREKEQSDHAAMLRELQKLLSCERIVKDQIEHQLDQAQTALKAREKIPDPSEQYEKRIQNMSNELQAVRNRLKAAEIKAENPPQLLLDLQKQMMEMKDQHSNQVFKEQKRANEAEHSSKVLAQQSEDRISSLELKLSELSDVVGDYERLRYQDQCSIQKLKERVTQLDLENTVLANAAHSPTGSMDMEEENLDAEALVCKIKKLRDLLTKANERSNNPVNIEEIFADDVNNEESPTCRKYKEELFQLKEEFEKYKLRAQSVLKTKSNKDNTTSKEVETLKQQVNDFRNKIKMVHLHHEEELIKCRNKEENLSKTMKSLQAKHKQEIIQLQADHSKIIGELESEMKKQRDRTVSLLAERQKEIEHLKAHSTHQFEHEYLIHEHLGEESSKHERKMSAEEQAVSDLMHTPSSGQKDSNIIHFSREQARKDNEISLLRKQKRQLETTLRELQQNCSLKEEALQEKVDQLTDDVRRLERNKSRESANLEYLKNVFYKFLTSTKHDSRSEMLNAISTILEFSPKERDGVQAHFKGWWG